MLVALSVGCTLGLRWALWQGLEQWNALPLVLLMHGAQFSAVLAHGLSWRRGEAMLHWAAALMTYLTTLIWMSTWFEPLHELGALVQTLAAMLGQRGLPF
jgi:hypothetical protein